MCLTKGHAWPSPCTYLRAEPDGPVTGVAPRVVHLDGSTIHSSLINSDSSSSTTTIFHTSLSPRLQTLARPLTHTWTDPLLFSTTDHPPPGALPSG